MQNLKKLPYLISLFFLKKVTFMLEVKSDRCRIPPADRGLWGLGSTLVFLNQCHVLFMFSCRFTFGFSFRMYCRSVTEEEMHLLMTGKTQQMQEKRTRWTKRGGVNLYKSRTPPFSRQPGWTVPNPRAVNVLNPEVDQQRVQAVDDRDHVFPFCREQGAPLIFYDVTETSM